MIRAGKRPLFRARPRRTEAIVVRLNAYAETSAVAVLLSADLGRVHAVAKGSRRLRNSFRGPLDRGVLYRVRLGRRGETGLWHLHGAEVIEPLPRLRADPARFHAAALVLEVAGDLLREEEPDPALFRLTAFTLKALDRAPPERLGPVLALFLARAVRHTGQAPELGACTACGRPLEEGARLLLSPARGGVLHARCGRGEPGARPVAAGSLELLRRFWREPAAELLAGGAGERECAPLRRILQDWLEQVLERRFRSVGAAEREIARRLR